MEAGRYDIFTLVAVIAMIQYACVASEGKLVATLWGKVKRIR